MQLLTFRRSLRLCTTITLFFFCWSFGPLYAPLAYAVEKKPVKAKGNSPTSAGTPRDTTAPGTAERFEKALDAIRENVGKAGEKAAKGSDDSAERAAIKAKRTEIEAADADLKKEFAATEKKLKAANLPDTIRQRHTAFVAQYEKNLKELKANLDNIDKAATKTDRAARLEQARQHLEKTKTPSRHQKLDPNNLPNRMVKGKERAPRLKKEEFEKDFPSPKKTGQKLAVTTKEDGLSSHFAKGGQEGDLLHAPPTNKPIQLAYNDFTGGIASDVPFTINLPRPYAGEGRGTAPAFTSGLASAGGVGEFQQIAFADTAPYQIALATPPTADDLAETPEVQFTPEILAKAQELGTAPGIFTWIRNNIKYEPYYGSLKGAQQTLLERAGNDSDQASLLIAMLRAIKSPAKYSYGTIELPIDRAMKWLGVTDAKTAGSILATNGVPGTLIKSNDGTYTSIRLEHCWVTAYTNMLPSFGAKNAVGNMWVPLDPSYKENKITAQVNLSKQFSFDETGYLASRSDIPPSLSYFFAVEDYHTANYTDNIFEIFYAKRITEESFDVLLGTLPYKVLATAQQYTEVPDSVRHTLTLTLTDAATTSSVNTQKKIAEITGKKITVTYKAASQADETIIATYGGLLQTPSYMAQVKPTVRLDDTVILEGPAVSLGAALKLSADFYEPGLGTSAIETDLSAGIYYCLGVAALNPSQDKLASNLDSLQSLTGTIYDSVNTLDNQIGSLLYGIAMEYFSKTNNAARSLAALMHIQNTNVTSAAFVSVKVSYAQLFGMPMSPATITGLNMDVRRYMLSPFSITGDTAQAKAFMRIQGLNSSFFEHSIMEMLTKLESISTVKALQIANETGIPIYTITTTNINTILPQLTVSQTVKTDIQNALNAGKEVTISRDNVTLNDWTGAGYIIRDTTTGAGAYMITSGAAGSDTTQPVANNAVGLIQGRIAAFAIGKAATDWSEPFGDIASEIDHVLMWHIGDMLLGKGYIPVIEHTESKAAFVNLANLKNVYLFYYVGHGTSGSIVPYPDNKAEEVVYPSDIHADTRITFLNSCASAKQVPFKSTFGIDNKSSSDDKRIYLGWSADVNWGPSSWFGYRWWKGLVDAGLNATDAAMYQKSAFTMTDSTGPIIRMEGDTQMKLSEVQ